MTDPSVVVAVLGLIVFAIPIVGALWNIFAVRETLSARINDNKHELELLGQHLQHLHDQQELVVKGLQEVAQHTRTRSQHAEERLADRLSSIEGHLSRTSEFRARGKG